MARTPPPFTPVGTSILHIDGMPRLASMIVRESRFHRLPIEVNEWEEASMALIQTKPIEQVVIRETQPGLVNSNRRELAEAARLKYLRIALRIVGVAFI